ERGEMGGICTNDGCAPTRVLAKTARLLRDTAKFAEYGLEGERPTLNWERLLARTQYVVNALHEKKQLIGHLQASGVETFIGVDDAHFVDAHTINLSPLLRGDDALTNVSRVPSQHPSPTRRGETLNAEKFIIAAGGHARRLNIPGGELALTHSDVWTLKELPKRVVIVGGAATGCQLASVLEQFGAEVTLLDIASRILPTEDELTSETMRAEFEARGMKVMTGIAGITRIEQERGGLRLVYQCEGNEIGLETDAVIIAVGWVGNLERLNLD